MMTYLLIFLLAALTSLISGPRVRLVLILVGLLAIVAGGFWLYMPSYFGGDGFYRVASWSMAPFSLGGGFWVGALGRRLLDGIPLIEGSLFGRMGRGLILTAFVVFGGVVFFVGSLGLSSVVSAQKVRFDQVDLDLVFRNAISDHLVPSPDPAGFEIRGADCGLTSGLFYRIKYRAATGDMRDYFVAYERAAWKLHDNLSEDSLGFTLPQVIQPY